ncbi:MAG TPA: YfiR family protein [Candidatus Kapabacteria bacterium]|nr:YfiR family protein [Candidatus Kapabacteria bacterium]
MMIKKLSILLLSLWLLIIPFWGQQKKAVVKAEEYNVKIAFIKKFFDFIKWPSDNSASGQFIFGIIGNTPFNDQMEKLSKKISIPNKTVLIKPIADLDLAQVKECHVLIIGNIDAEQLKEILAIIGNQPILSISDTEGFAEIGVLINFFKAENNVKFEINYSAVKKSGLTFSSKLYKLARLIDHSR